MKQSTFSAVMANSIQKVLQGYTKGIRIVAVLTFLFTVGVGHFFGEDYQRVTDLSQLSDGDQVILVNNAANNTTSARAMSTTQNSNNRGSTEVSISSAGVITLSGTHTIQILTLKINSSGQYGFHTGNGYLYLPSANNYLRTNTVAITNAPSGQYAWTPSIATSGNTNKAVSLNNANNANYYLQYNTNNGTGLFASYKNNQGNPCIFKKTQTCTLNSITLNTDDVQKSFCKDDDFDYTGLVVTANYAGGCASKTVNPTSVSSPTMGSIGTMTITVSYTEGNITKNATYSITVTSPYTIKWIVDGDESTEEVCAGKKVSNPPTIPSPLPCGDVFVGWTTEAYKGNSEPDPLYATADAIPAITGDQTFYAVFADYANE